MTTKIAILHGGPADRVQTVVERFQPTIYYALMEPFRWPTPEELKQTTAPNPPKARYDQVMSPMNMGRNVYNWYGPKHMPAHLPDQEVCLYVYCGEEL